MEWPLDDIGKYAIDKHLRKLCRYLGKSVVYFDDS